MGLLDNILSSIDAKKRTFKRSIMDMLDNPGDWSNMTAARMKENIYGSPENWDAMKRYYQQQQYDQKLKDAAQQSMTNNMINESLGAIVSPSVAKTLNTVKKLPEDQLFVDAVSGTKGAEITDDGLKMMIQRNQNPLQSMEPSVRGGVFYLPEGAAQAKYYSTGKNGYGGQEKISGETLVQNPLFVKGATGGKAPESAFDSLLGKGAYQNMRTDALKAFGPYGTRPLDREEYIYSFLEKYAPELSDQAYYIAKNSTQGNQLAYALQEAAVGSAVRNAGHDSVLGYSKGKQGPFISELFDVRESHYPSRFGDSTVWDSLLGDGTGK